MVGGRVAITDSASYGADRAADAGDLLMVICFVSAGLQWYFSILVKIYCLSTIVRVLNLVSKFLFLCVRKSCVYGGGMSRRWLQAERLRRLAASMKKELKSPHHE